MRSVKTTEGDRSDGRASIGVEAVASDVGASDDGGLESTERERRTASTEGLKARLEWVERRRLVAVRGLELHSGAERQLG